MSRYVRSTLSLIGLIVTAISAQSQTYTWNSTVSGNWDVGANWDTNPTVPVSSDTTELRFNANGATSYSATNNIGADTFILNRLTVNNTGTGLITLGGAAAANTYTFAGAAPTIDVQNGSVLFLGLMAGTANVTKTGAGTFVHDSNNGGFTGTLTIDGGTFVNRATTNATTNFNPTSIVVNNGGTYQFGDAGIGNPNVPNSTYVTVNTGGLVSWQEGEDFGGFNLNGGTIDLSGGNANTNGSTAQSWTGGSILGTFVYGAGSGTRVINKTTAGTVTVGGGVTIINHQINIEEGVISYLSAANLGGVVTGFTLGGAATVGVFEYQGATPGTRASSFTMTGGGGEIRVANAAGRMTLSGNTLGTSALTKTGAGTLVLGGTVGHAGGTFVNAGAVIATPSTTAAASGFTVANGATLGVNTGNATQTFTAPTVALGTTGSTLQFDLNVSTTSATPFLTVSDANGLNLNGGAHTLRITNTGPLPVGTYTAIDYLGTAVTSGFTLSLPGRTPGTIVYNTANTSIDVNVTGTTDTIRWGGQVNGTWDVGTAANVGGTNNWRLNSNNNNTNFIQTDFVTFDDTASGNFTVSIPAPVQPAAMTVNTANTYIFTGPGGIGGTTGLTKQGTGTVVLATDNAYTGTTLVSAGTLQLGDGGTTGAVTGQITMATATTLAINRTTDLTLPGVLSTAGATINTLGTGVTTITGAIDGFAGTVLTKTGPGTVRFLGNNSFLGNLAINGGTVVLTDEGGGGDLNAALVEINNTGRFEFGFAGNPDLPANTIVRVNTGGTALFNIGEDYGAIELRGGTYTSRVNNNLGGTSVLESGTFTNLDGVNGSLAGAGLVQKTTAGTVTFNGIALNGTGGLSIENGVLATNAAILANGVITFGTTNTAGTLRLTDAATGVVTALGNQVITLNDGGGVIDVATAGKTYTHGGLITGAGPLAKAGAGTLTLTGTNNYTGPTTVNAGVLRVNGQTGANSGTGTGAVTVASGGVLGGDGRVGGAVTVSTGGTIAAGTAPASRVLTTGSTVGLNGTLGVQILGTGADEAGQLTAGGTTTLGAASVIELNLGSLTANDLRAAVGIGNTRNYTVLNTTAGTVSGIFANAPTNGPVDFSSSGFLSSEWTIAYGSNNVILSFTPVPEPTMLTLAGAACVMGYLRLRRHGAKPA